MIPSLRFLSFKLRLVSFQSAIDLILKSENFKNSLPNVVDTFVMILNSRDTLLDWAIST